MANPRGGLFLNLVKKAVGLPTGDSSCCAPAPAEQATARAACCSPAEQASADCCSSPKPADKANTASCCG